MKKSHSKTHLSVSKVQKKAFFQRKAEGHFFSDKKEVQARLKGGRRNDKYENEADAIADTIVDKGVQTKPAFDDITPLVRNHQGTQKKEDIQEMTEVDVAPQDQDKIQKQEDVQEMQDEAPQAKGEESETMTKEEPVQKQEDVQEMQDEAPQAKGEESETMTKEEPVQKQEDVQEMQDKAPQAKGEEDETMTKEEPVQKQEDVQEMQDKAPQAKGEEDETMAKEESVQKQEDIQGMQDEAPQAKTDEGETMTKEESVQKQEEVQEEVPQAKGEEGEPMAKEDEVQGKGGSGFISGKVENLLKASKGKGSPLPEAIRQKMEKGFGADFSVVRIHTGSDAQLMSKSLKAQAFAHGKDIFFNAGKFDINSKQGLQLLAHELTHTVQQGAVDKINKEEGPDLTPSNPGLEAPSSPESPAQETPKGDATAPDQVAVTDEKAVKGKASDGEKGELGEKEGEANAVPRSPEEDPNFQALQDRSKATAKKQKSHRPAGVLAQNAGDAAPSPGNEVASRAQETQVKEMDAQPAGKFDAASFKKMLLEQIKKILPKNEDEADDFADSNKMNQVKDAASNKVEQEKTNAAGNIETATNKPPDTASIQPRETVDLKTPKTGRKPAGLEPSKAMPPKRPNSEVNQPLAENAKEVDDEMAQNNVTEEQLAKSEEPTFLKALDSKKTAQDHSKTAPEGLRKDEEGVISGAKQDAEAKGDQQLAGIYGDRKSLLGSATKVQKETSKGNTSERERIAKEIDGIYQQAKTDVEERLTNLDTYVDKEFDEANKNARADFEQYVDKKMEDYKDDRYGGWYNPVGWVKRGKDALAGLPDEVNKFFTEGRERYINNMDIALTAIALHIADELNAAKDRIARGKQDVKDYVDKLPKNLKKYGKEKQAEIQDKFAELEDSVDSKQEELIDTIAMKYKESLEEVDARIEEMKAANRGLIDKAIDAVKGVIETIKKLKQMVENLLSAIKQVISVIIEDPIGFMKRLFKGIGQGIDNFMSNILKHLLAGLFKWLTGAMGPMGITIPDDIFSLKGIFSLVLQVLGLGWDFIRRKAVKLMGEKAVVALEKGFEMFTILKTKGVDGIWQFLKDKFQDLKETIIDAIKQMIITKVIEAGIKWLLSLIIPGAGFIKAIMAIKDLLVFFVESAIMLIPAITDAILALASGNVSMVAKAIEMGLALLIPLVINLFAKLIGLGGLAKRVQKIIKKVRKRIDRAINKLILKAKKKLKSLFKKRKKKGGKEKVKKDEKKHQTYANAIKKVLLKKPNKPPKSIKEFYSLKKKEAKNLESKYQPKLAKGIKLNINFQPEAQDLKDNDLDILIKIAPNTTKVNLSLPFQSKHCEFEGGWEKVAVLEGTTISFTKKGKPKKVHLYDKHGREAALVERLQKTKKVFEQARHNKLKNLFEELTQSHNSISKIDQNLRKSKSLKQSRELTEKKMRHQDKIFELNNTIDFLQNVNTNNLDEMKLAAEKVDKHNLYEMVFQATSFKSEAQMRKVINQALNANKKEIEEKLPKKQKGDTLPLKWEHNEKPLYAKGVKFDDNMNIVEIEGKFTHIEVVLMRTTEISEPCRFTIYTGYPSQG